MVKLPHTFLLLAGALVAASSLTACAQAVVATSSGGSGGDTSTGGDGGSGAGGGGGSTTSTGPCTSAEECASLSDACNIGACINGECGTLPANNGSACDDGKQCTQNDTCQNGVCVSGSLKPCTSGNPCMVGVCDPASDQCVEMPGNNGASCSFGDPCILTAACLNGICQPSQQVNCSFLDSECATGVCDPMSGCVAVPKNDGAPCNDFLFCTVQDQCVAGQCKGFPNTCNVGVNDPCKTGFCNEAQKTCVVVPGNDGAACDDNNLCTAGETCLSGSCVGGSPANDGAMCDDGNGCTGGTTCSAGACNNPQSQIVACVDGDMCCPAGCAGDKDCLYWQSGVQLNVPAADLVGWTQCHQDKYDGFAPLSTVLSQCDKGKLLLACRPTGAANFTVVAMGLRDDVLFECGMNATCTHSANGVGWYYSSEYSWGFAPAGSPVNRNSCDIVDSQTYPGGGASDGDQRICWHTGGNALSSGWRCGKPDFLGGTYERLVFEAD